MLFEPGGGRELFNAGAGGRVLFEPDDGSALFEPRDGWAPFEPCGIGKDPVDEKLGMRGMPTRGSEAIMP